MSIGPISVIAGNLSGIVLLGVVIHTTFKIKVLSFDHPAYVVYPFIFTSALLYHVKIPLGESSHKTCKIAYASLFDPE